MARRSGGVPSKRIAELAGVSEATVSRVLRGGSGVSEQLRQRVLQAAAATHAPPLDAARVAARSLGVVVSSLRTTDARILQSLVTCAAGVGYAPAIFVRHQATQGWLRSALGQVDAAVFDDAREAAEFAAQRPGVRTVSLQHTRGIAVAQVYPDDHACGLEIAGRIAVTGRVRLAAVGDVRHGEAYSPLVQGLIDGALRHDLDLPHGRLLDCGTSRRDAVACATELFHRLGARPEVVVCSSDEVAIGVIEAASRLSISVPSDVWVIGHGDSDLARVHDVTSSCVDHEQMARDAVQVLGLPAGELPEPAHRGVPYRIRVRATAALPGEAAH